MTSVKQSLQDEISVLASTLFCSEDQPAIRKSLRTCLYSLSRVYCTDNSITAFTLVVEGVATPQLKQQPATATIAFCGVSHTLQGKGIGSKLLKETISGIFQAGFTTCQLIVDEWNVGARRLYERFGFKVIMPLREEHTIGFVMELKSYEWQEDEVLQPLTTHTLLAIEKLKYFLSCLLCHQQKPLKCISVSSS